MLSHYFLLEKRYSLGMSDFIASLHSACNVVFLYLTCCEIVCLAAFVTCHFLWCNLGQIILKHCIAFSSVLI